MTWFDGLLLGVLAFSALFAVIRGAIREVSTLAALGAGAGLSFLLFNPVLGLLGLKGSFFGMIAVGGALLAFFFVALYVAFHFGLKQLRLGPTMALADRVGGGVFGVVRGLALIGLGFLGYAYYLDEPRRPAAVTNAALLPIAEASAKFFENLAPYKDDQKILTPDELNNKLDAANDGYPRQGRAALAEIVATTTSAQTSQAETILVADDEAASAPSPTQSAAEDAIAGILKEQGAGDY